MRSPSRPTPPTSALLDGSKSRVPALPSMPLVGRAAELDSLEGWLRDVAAGRGSTMFIAGAGGVGKTRVATTLAERARQAKRVHWNVAVGRVFAVETGVPYAVFSDALLPLLRGIAPAALTVLTRGGGSWLTSICPAFTPDGSSRTEDAASDAKSRLFWSFAQFLGRLAAHEPLLLVLDNVQWADSASLELLHFVGRQIAGERIGILCTYNEAELEQNPALLATEQSLLSLGVARLLRMEPLSHAETERLVCETFHVDAATVRRFVARLYSWTRGHPFFIEETLKALVDAGRLHERDGRWLGWELEVLDLPRSVRAAVSARMDRLAPPVRTLATVAAVVGTRVGYEVLRAVSGLPEADVLEAVDELRRHGILVESAAERGVSYEFSHPMLPEVLYSEIGRARARLLHASVAEALEAIHGDDALAHADLLAFHYARADARGGLAGKAVRYLGAAGRNALARHADREAVAYLSAAFDLLGSADEHEGGTESIVEDLARARQRVGEYDAAMKLWERARSEAARNGEHERLARIERRIGLACYWSGRHGDALAHLDAGLEAARAAGDDVAVSQIQLTRSSCFQALGRGDDAAREVHAALDVAERAGDASLLARAHRALLFLHTFMGPPDVARHHGERAVELAEQVGERNVAWSAHWGLAMLSGFTGRSTEIAHHIAASERLAEGLHSPLLSLWTDEVTIECLYGAGDLDGALATADRAVQMARALSQRTLLPRLLVWAALVHIARGAFDRAREHLDEAWGMTGAHAIRSRPMDVHTYVPAHTGFAQYYLATGDHKRAIEIGEAGLAIADRSGYVVWAIHRLLPAIIEAALWRNDVTRARRTAARLREVSTRIGHRLGLVWSDAADGLIARLEGDHARAAQLLAQSADQLEQVPWVLDAGRLRRFLARELIELGDREGAARELRRSHDTLVRLRAEVELSHTREMLRELGARMPARALSVGAGALTGRELDIVRLVVAGKSNKDIGATLDISPRTASTHVSNILAKLSVRTRGELAELVRQGALPTE